MPSSDSAAACLPTNILWIKIICFSLSLLLFFSCWCSLELLFLFYFFFWRKTNPKIKKKTQKNVLTKKNTGGNQHVLTCLGCPCQIKLIDDTTPNVILMNIVCVSVCVVSVCVYQTGLKRNTWIVGITGIYFI